MKKPLSLRREVQRKREGEITIIRGGEETALYSVKKDLAPSVHLVDPPKVPEKKKRKR